MRTEQILSGVNSEHQNETKTGTSAMIEPEQSTVEPLCAVDLQHRYDANDHNLLSGSVHNEETLSSCSELVCKDSADSLDNMSIRSRTASMESFGSIVDDLLASYRHDPGQSVAIGNSVTTLEGDSEVPCVSISPETYKLGETLNPCVPAETDVDFLAVAFASWELDLGKPERSVQFSVGPNLVAVQLLTII